MTDNYLVAIDDDPALLVIIAQAAAGSPYRVETTTDPTVFKALVEGGEPSLVILDLQMPECDGVELLRFLYDKHSRAHIVMMSGVDQRVLNIAKGVGQGFGLKMADVLQKPVRIADLRALLDRLRSTRPEVDVDQLRRALVEDQIVLFYQPMIDLKQNRLIGWEALARWRHPQLGLVTPDRFIGLAEREGLITQLTERVLDLAIRRQGDPGRLPIDGWVSVNLAAADLADGKLPDRLSQACAKYGVSPNLIRLELTETGAMKDAAGVTEALTRIRLKGFKLAIDDFGTGYSSMIQLHRLPFSEMKIDQSFVREMQTSDEARLIVGATAGLGHALSMELVAEGIETREIADQLKALGCEIGQGYYWSKPMPPEDIPAWCGRNPELLGA